MYASQHRWRSPRRFICASVRITRAAPCFLFSTATRFLSTIFGQACGAEVRRCHWCFDRGHSCSSVSVTNDVLEQPLLLRDGSALFPGVVAVLPTARSVFVSLSSICLLLRMGTAQRMQTQAPQSYSRLANSRMPDDRSAVSLFCRTSCHTALQVAIVFGTVCLLFFGLWSVYVPPSPLGPVGQSIVPGTISRGSLGCRDRLPAERGPGTG